MYKIVKTNRIDIKTIEEWKELWSLSKNKNYFNSFEWFENYIFSFSITKYILLKGYSDNKLQFLLPLIQTSYKQLKCIGGKYLDKVSFLYKDNLICCLESIEQYAKKNRITIILYECDFDINIIKNGDFIIEIASDNPYVDLTKDINNVMKHKEKRYIENIIRKNKELNFKIMIGKETQKYIETIFNIENKSNKLKRKKALFINENCKNLFRNISKTEYGMLCILYYNNIPIAHMYGLIAHPKTFMAYHMAYDIEYRKYQPGKLVIYYLLNYLRQESYYKFDFSRGNSMLKRHFSVESVKNYNIYINPNICVKMHLMYKKNMLFLKNITKKILREMGLWKK